VDLLRALFNAIEQDASVGGAIHSLVVGLGDYVDRSMEPKAVIQAMVSGIAGCDLVALRGNHEQMLIDFLENPVRHGAEWLANGAIETLRSYEVPLNKLGRFDANELQWIRDSLARQIPVPHLMLLQRMPLTYVSGDYFFVHAGVRPQISIERQAIRDLLWIREGFADRDRPFEKVVVHGHTPVDQPYLGKYRINLDTGAYFTGRLSCLVLEGTNIRSLNF
jgi:serine/threonine protein phosphatase 1